MRRAITASTTTATARRSRVRAVAAWLWLVGLGPGCGSGPERGAAPARREVPAPLAIPAATGSDPGSPVESPAESPAESTEPPLGQPAPAWGALPWLSTPPLRLEDLRDQVVLIRFWTDTCPFCRATAPALAQIDADYRDRGVTVIGMYHPKPRGSSRAPQQVAEVTAEWGWRFPVALDLDWAVLDAFWLRHGERRYTSVSFVLDRRGVIRHIHPGPEFHPGGPDDHTQCRHDYAEIRATLDALLAEPRPGASPAPGAG